MVMSGVGLQMIISAEPGGVSPKRTPTRLHAYGRQAGVDNPRVDPVYNAPYKTSVEAPYSPRSG